MKNIEGNYFPQSKNTLENLHIPNKIIKISINSKFLTNPQFYNLYFNISH